MSDTQTGTATDSLVPTNAQGMENTVAVFTREGGTQYSVEPFKLAKTKEIGDRFRGDHTINIPLPVAVKGNLEQTLANLRAFVSPEADFAEVLVAKFNGQGLRLDLQKTAKEYLAPGSETTKEMSVEEALAGAQEAVDAERLGAPRQRGTGGSKGKVAQAEAKAAKTANTAVEMYRALVPAQRSIYGPQLVSIGAFTQEQLDEIDAELKQVKGR